MTAPPRIMALLRQFLGKLRSTASVFAYCGNPFCFQLFEVQHGVNAVETVTDLKVNEGVLAIA